MEHNEQQPIALAFDDTSGTVGCSTAPFLLVGLGQLRDCIATSQPHSGEVGGLELAGHYTFSGLVSDR